MKKSKIISFILAIAVMLASLTLPSAAAILYSGTCGADGDNLTWTLDDAGKLTISGTGAMMYWENDGNVPWYSYRESIKTVDIADGVTTIGNCAFYGCTSLKSITIPSDVTMIGAFAFCDCSALTSAYFYGDAPACESFAFANTSSSFKIYYLADKTGGVKPWTTPRWNSSGRDTYNTAIFMAETVLCGDADGGGAVTWADVYTLAHYLSGWPDVAVVSANCDADGDGAVTWADTYAIARHLLGWDGYETLPTSAGGI